jgi:type II secretory pathway pseudopilin PulG
MTSGAAAEPALPQLRQHGQLLVAVALIISIATGAVIYAFFSPAARRNEEQKIAATVLAQAREALIGRAASDNNRPGSLPCPDLVTNIPGSNMPNDGIADLLVGNECPSYIGRLPWRTLDLPDLRDASGERLWYALSRALRDDNSAQPINSNTVGNLSITGSVAATNVIAIVFAPGAVVGTQVRDAANANVVANYLEGGNEVSGTTTFTAGAAGASFNDRLLAIGSDALFPVVEIRVAREARMVLRAFYNDPANAYFPFANAYGDNTYQCTDSEYSGRISRFFTDQCKTDPADPDWKGVTWPSWFFANNWHEVVFYAVASKCAKPASPACSASGGLLTVAGLPAPNNNIQALVIMPGRGIAGQTRPCAAVTDCLEDPENTDGDFDFTRSAVTPTVNDRLYVVSP